MAIRAMKDPMNFYKRLENSDGTDICVTVPQFYNEAVRHICDDTFLTVCILPVIQKFQSCWNMMEQTRAPIDDEYFFLETDFERCCEIMHIDGEPAIFDDLISNSCTILIELWIKGYRCTDGVSTLDVTPKRCMFIISNGVSRFRLHFIESDSKPAPVFESVPSHMVAMFNKLPSEERICPICKEEISSDLCQTKCFHHFHVACIRQIVGRLCPNCRQAL